jgi:hypothetical protein
MQRVRRTTLTTLGAAITLAGGSAAVALGSTPAATRACLKAHGAAIFSGRQVVVHYEYPEIRAELFWSYTKKKSFPGLPPVQDDGVALMFTRNASTAKRLEPRFRRLGASLGWTKREISLLLGRDRNVVWFAPNPPPPGTKRLSILRSCLTR